ncbi:MAG: MBL fold metallo-hydrolase [Halioglobus sp.]
MKINTIFSRLALVLTFFAGSLSAHEQMQHVRNATIKVMYADTIFLIDPMLAKKGAYPGFEGTYRSELRNPTIELPISAQEVIEDVDAVIVTHVHLDHWDDAAQKLLPKDIPLFVQNEADADVVRSQGFTGVRILQEHAEFGGVSLNKTGGQHGSDYLYSKPEIAQILGEVMGVVFKAPEHKTVYVAGDTIWCDEVDEALKTHNPDVVILNTGHAILNGLEDHPIIMGKEDTLHAYKVTPGATIVAVHMDAINHCSLSRKELREYVEQKGIEDRVLIPADGEVLKF